MKPTPIHTILDAHSLRSVIESTWQIEVRAVRLHALRVRDTYTVTTDNGPAMLQISAAGDDDGTRRQHAFATHLAAHGVPVPAPYPGLATVDAPEGRRLAILTPQVSAQRLDTLRSPAACGGLGSSLATLHAAPPIPNLPGWSPRCGLDTLAARIGELGVDYSAAAAAAATAVARVREHVIPNGDAGLHGDVDATNALVRDDGTVVLIDFDAVTQGPRAYDAACFLAQLFAWPWPQKEACAKAFLDGLPPFETEGLPALIALRLLHVLERHLNAAPRRGAAHLTPRFVAHLTRDAQRALDDPPAWW